MGISLMAYIVDYLVARAVKLSVHGENDFDGAQTARDMPARL